MYRMLMDIYINDGYYYGFLRLNLLVLENICVYLVYENWVGWFVIDRFADWFIFGLILLL